MKKVSELVTNERVDVFAQVMDVQELKTKSSPEKPYVLLVLSDLTGTIEAKFWEKTLKDTPKVEVGKVIKVRAKVEEFRKKKYLSVEQLRCVNEKDNVNLNEIVAPTDGTPSVVEPTNQPENPEKNSVENSADTPKESVSEKSTQAMQNEVSTDNSVESTNKNSSEENQSTMEEPTLSPVKRLTDLVKGEKVDMFVFVRMLVEGMTKTTTPSPYVTLTLEDSSGTVSGKFWDKSVKDLESMGVQANKVVKVQGTYNEWVNKNNNGKVEPQITVSSIRSVTPEDEVNMEDFVKSAPIKPEVMFDSIMELADSFTNDELKRVITSLFTRYKEALLIFPGALRIHHANKSELLYHVYTMLGAGDALSNLYPVNKELLFTGIIVHDIGKLEELEVNEFGLCSEYTESGKLLGHMISGVMMVHDICSELKISKRVEWALEHFIVSHHYEETWGAFKKPKFLEAELLHHLDLMDSRMDVFLNVLSKTEENDFTEAVYPLEKRSVFKLIL